MTDPYKGYYTFPFSGEGFEGDVIQLDREAMRVLFQTYTVSGEHKFREGLERMDEWFFDKPYRVQQKWLQYVVKWLQKEKEDNRN